MIQKIGDYYVYDDNHIKEDASLSNQNIVKDNRESYPVVGDIKQKIQAIRSRFSAIKQSEKLQALKAQNKKQSIFDKIQENQLQDRSSFDIEIYIPEQILKFDQRISKIQQKLHPNQIFRRKIQQKGPLVQRIKILHQKLLKVLQKSSQIVIGNIQTYCTSLEDKQQFLKIFYLRQVLNKTQGIKQEMLILEKYLQNLSEIKRKISGMQPISKTVQNHEQILLENKKVSQKIRVLFEKMKKQYEVINKEIDNLNL